MKLALPGFRKVRTEAVAEAFRHFRPALDGQGPAIAGASFLSIAIVVLETLQPWPVKFVFDALLRPAGAAAGAGAVPEGLEPSVFLGLCVAAIPAISLLIGAIRIRATVLGAEVGRRVTTRIRRRLFEHLQRLPFAFHVRSRTGDLLVRIFGDVNMIRDLLFASWISLLQRGLTFLAMAGVMLVLDPVLAACALLPFPVLGLLARRTSRKLRSVARRQRAREGSAAAFAAECLREVRVVKACGAETAVTKTFIRDARSGERAGVEAARITAGIGLRTEVLTGIGLALVVWTGGRSVIEGSLSAGDLWVFIAYARSLYKPLRGITREGVRLGRATACAERLLEVFRLPPEAGSDGDPAPPFAGDLRFEDVRLAYDGGRPALRGLDLHVPAGSLAVLAGPNGSGKSTLVAILLRLLPPDSGRVLIDGADAGRFGLGSYRARFAYVPQEVRLFGASLRENIAFGRPDATAAEVEAAARAALIHDTIERLPGGYDSELGEGGCTLSGGEARRVMLARAALRDARILVLDEPLAGIDPEARPLVAEAIRRIAAGRTALVVSHEAVAELAPDLVVHLDAGVVARVEAGVRT